MPIIQQKISLSPSENARKPAPAPRTAHPANQSNNVKLKNVPTTQHRNLTNGLRFRRCASCSSMSSRGVLHRLQCVPLMGNGALHCLQRFNRRSSSSVSHQELSCQSIVTIMRREHFRNHCLQRSDGSRLNGITAQTFTSRT